MSLWWQHPDICSHTFLSMYLSSQRAPPPTDVCRTHQSHTRVKAAADRNRPRFYSLADFSDVFQTRGRPCEIGNAPRFGQSLLSAGETLSDKSCKRAHQSVLLDICCLRWPQSMKPERSWGRVTHERKIINIHRWLPFWWYWTINQEMNRQRYRQNLHGRHLCLFDRQNVFLVHSIKQIFGWNIFS